MWYKKTIGEQVFLCYNDGVDSIAIDETAEEHFLFQAYLLWVAEGNTAEEWTGA
jgi:hypothetical protein